METVETHAALIIPMFNEASVIDAVVRRARSNFSTIICVDDGSSDDSADVAAVAGAVVVRHPINLGQGAAIETGFAVALRNRSLTHFVTFDADGQHDVSDALAMVERARRESLDCVLGSRFLGEARHLPAARRLLLRGAVKFTAITTGLTLTDAHNGLRVFNRKSAEQMSLRLTGMSHASEILSLIARHGWTYAEHPVTVSYTDYSRAKGQKGYNALNVLFDLAVNRVRAIA